MHRSGSNSISIITDEDTRKVTRIIIEPAIFNVDQFDRRMEGIQGEEVWYRECQDVSKHRRQHDDKVKCATPSFEKVAD